MASTYEVERQLSNAGYLPQGADFSPRLTAPADIEGIVRGAATRYGVDPDQALAVARLESSLNPRAQNPRSSAGGLFQFIDSTWNQYGGGDKYDPARNADAGARYLRDVRDRLAQGLGRAPTVGEIYLGHQQGPAGALRILKDPDGLAKDAVGPDAVVLNGGTIGMTNRDFAARWGRRAARAAGQSPGILDTIGAAARQNIGLVSLLGYGMPFGRGVDDPTFNAITTADQDPALRPYLSQFIDVRNRDEYDRTAERIRAASDDRETLAAAGPFGTVASVAAGILDPINLIPVGGGAWTALRAGRYAEGALAGLLAGSGGAALQELVLQQADPTRTAEETGMNIVGGALGGAGLGVGGVIAGQSTSRLARAGILGAGGAAGGAVAGAGEALYAGQDLPGALATIGTAAVLGGVLGGSVGALARPGRTARDGLNDLARTVDIETATGNGAIHADVRRQLLAAGRSEAEADAGGRLWQSHVDAMARATGVSQEEVYRRIGLEVRAGEAPEGALAQRLADLPGDLRQVVERAQAEADASGRQVWVWHDDAGYTTTMGGRPDGAEFVGRVFGREASAEMGGDVLFQSVGRDSPPGSTRGGVDFSDGMARVTLGAKADASTFLHESGHVFLHTLDRLAKDAPELAGDLAKVREWLGNDGGAITREQHEQFARGFEAYLRDGKAPNSALRDVFERFRDWLTAIYRSLADLDVELSDDVRGVMDRLIGIESGEAPSEPAARSVSAAALPQATMDDLRIARGAELPARALARVPVLRGPDLILGTSPIRAARWAMRKLMRPVLATVGDLEGRNATENVEAATMQWHGTEVAAKQRSQAAYAEYVKAAAKVGEAVLPARQFREIVSMAGRRGDSGANLQLGPEAQKAVAAVAKVYREEVFDPLLKQALETGLLTQAQVDKSRRFADSYVPRVWNIPKIIEKRTQFTNEIVMPQVVRDWEDARRKLAQVRQTTRFADEQLRQIEAAGIEHGGPEAAAFIAEGPQRTPSQIMRENIKQLQSALDDPSAQWADGDEDRARMLIAKARTPTWAQEGMEGIRKGGPALTAAEAQEVQDMLYRTRGLRPTDDTDIGVRATRAVQAMRERVKVLEDAAKTARETPPLASMTDEQAAEASRLMAKQAEKLANDADTVRALADQYETALKKSLRERAKAYRTLDADDNLGRLDEEELPDVASDIVDALVGHTNNRLQYEALKVQARGALKEKTFNVHDTRVDGSRGGEIWIENDIEQLAETYVRTLAPDVELKRLTGDVNAEPMRQQIVQEYTDRANAMEDGTDKRKLDARMKRDLEAFDGVVARLRGSYGVPRDAGEVWVLRASRLLKAFNFMRLMGWGPVSQLSDLGRIVHRSGMSRFLGDAVMPMVSNWQAVKMTMRDLQRADIATELVRSSMAMRGAELFDDYGRTSMVERAAHKAAAGASRLFGLDHWNQATKAISGLIAQHTLVEGVQKLASGAEMKPMEIADLSRVGIGVREAEFLKPFLDEFGQDVHGVFVPNAEDWAGERAGDAARLWRSALRQVVDDMVIHPGQDRSLGLSKPGMSLLAQLETFNLVSTQRTILAGIQRRDAGVLIGSAVMIGLGMLSYYLKAKIAGWELPDDPGRWILQGVNASGLTAVFGSIDQRLLATTRGAVGSEALIGSPTKSRFAAADYASLFGPSASMGQTLFTSAQNAAAGDWNWKDTHRLRSLVPLQNYFALRWLYDAGERGVNDMFGVKQRQPMRQ